MIEPSSSPINNLLSALNNPEKKDTEKAQAIEKVTRVGSERHNRTLAFLVDNFHSIHTKNKSHAGAAQETASEETKKEMKRNRVEVKGDKTILTSTLVINEEASFEESKKETKNKKLENDPTKNKIGTDSPLTDEKPQTQEPEIGVILPIQPPKPPNPPANSALTVSQLTRNDVVNRTAAMTAISVSMNNIMGDAAMENLDAAREHNRKSAAVNLNKIETTEKEQSEMQKKADQSANIVSCAIQVASILLTVVMTAFSVLSGNPLLIGIAVAGLVVMFTDLALDAAGLPTIMGSIMEPIMKHIIQPIIEFFSGIVSSVLKSFGVNEHTSNLIANALGILFTVGFLVGAVVAARSSSILCAGVNRITAAIGNVLAKMTPNVARSFGHQLSTKASELGASLAFKANIGGSATAYSSSIATSAAAGLSDDVARVAATELSRQAATQGVQFIGTGVNITMQTSGVAMGVVGASGGIATAFFQNEVAKTHEEMVALNNTLMTNSEILKEVQSYVQDMMDKANQLMNTALEAQAQQIDTAKFILRHMPKSI